MLYSVPTLSISTKSSTKNFRVTSLWRHICQKGKNRKKNGNICFWSHMLGISKFHRVFYKSFLEWIITNKNIKNKTKQKTKQNKTLYFFLLGGLHHPIPIFERSPHPEGGSGNFLRYILCRNKILSANHSSYKHFIVSLHSLIDENPFFLLTLTVGMARINMTELCLLQMLAFQMSHVSCMPFVITNTDIGNTYE